LLHQPIFSYVLNSLSPQLPIFQFQKQEIV
jgi:hypothetical protein